MSDIADGGRCFDERERIVQATLSEAFGCPVHIRPRDFLEKTLASIFCRQPDMSGDQRKRLNPHELSAVGRTADHLMRALIIATDCDTAALRSLASKEEK